MKIRFVLHLIDVVSLAFRGPRTQERASKRAIVFGELSVCRLPALGEERVPSASRAGVVQGGPIFPARVPYYRAQFAKMIKQMEPYVFSVGGETQQEQRKGKTSLGKTPHNNGPCVAFDPHVRISIQSLYRMFECECK